MLALVFVLAGCYAEPVATPTPANQVSAPTAAAPSEAGTGAEDPAGGDPAGGDPAGGGGATPVAEGSPEGATASRAAGLPTRPGAGSPTAAAAGTRGAGLPTKPGGTATRASSTATRPSGGGNPSGTLPTRATGGGLPLPTRPSGQLTMTATVARAIATDDTTATESAATATASVAASTTTASGATAEPTAEPTAETATVEPAPTVEPGGLVVRKANPAGTPLAGACFRLAPVTGEPGAESCADDAGVVVFADLVPGDYRLIETLPPPGHAAIAELLVTIPSGDPVELPVVDEPLLGTLEALTIDVAGAPLPGACYQAEGPETYGPICDDGDGDVNTSPGGVAFGSIAVGDYVVRQTTAPEGTDPAAEQPVRVDRTAPATLTFTNAPTAPLTGGLEIVVTQPDGAPSAGACYALSGTAEVGPICDGEPGDAAEDTGVVRIEGLVPGAYRLRQTTVAEGLAPIAERDVTIEAGPGQAITVALEPAAPEGTPLGVPVAFRDADASDRLWLLLPGEPPEAVPFTGVDPAIEPAFSADRNRFAVLAFVPDTGDQELVIYDLPSRTQQAVPLGASGLRAQSLAWTADGATLALAVQTIADGSWDVLLYAIGGESRYTFLGQNPLGSVGRIAWEPGGARLAVETTAADGIADVWIVDAATADPPVPAYPTDTPTGDLLADWSPLGGRLLLVVDGALWSTDLANPAVQLAPAFAPERSPSWSSDGGFVAYEDPAVPGSVSAVDVNSLGVCGPVENVAATAWRPESAALTMVVAPDDGSPPRLDEMTLGPDCPIAGIELPRPDLQPSWSPDGQTLALFGPFDETNGRPILVLGADGTPRPIDTTAAPVIEVRGWAPDGSALALYADEDFFQPPGSLWVLTPDGDAPAPAIGSEIADAVSISAAWWPPEEP